MNIVIPEKQKTSARSFIIRKESVDVQEVIRTPAKLLTSLSQKKLLTSLAKWLLGATYFGRNKCKSI